MNTSVTKRFMRELFAGLQTPAEAARAAAYLDGWAGKHVYLPIESKQARRVQAARNMAANGMTDAAIVQALRERFSVSCRTARRDAVAAHTAPIEAPSSGAFGRGLLAAMPDTRARMACLRVLARYAGETLHVPTPSGPALRVRRARAFLDAGWTVADAVGSVQARFGVSLRSAQRDVKAARQTPSNIGAAGSDHSGF